MSWLMIQRQAMAESVVHWVELAAAEVKKRKPNLEYYRGLFQALRESAENYHDGGARTISESAQFILDRVSISISKKEAALKLEALLVQAQKCRDSLPRSM